jgi:hypothetical protein
MTNYLVQSVGLDHRDSCRAIHATDDGGVVAGRESLHTLDSYPTAPFVASQESLDGPEKLKLLATWRHRSAND